jgi:uncharacterized protein (TIGR00730 family)
MESTHMNIAVFCSSLSRPGDPDYAEGIHLGRLLASAGHTVITGGYIGTMEAVSRGATEAGGHVIGVTCDEIEAWRPGRANPWVQEERRFQTLHERLFSLIDDCDAAIALPGGIGTLAEIAMMWSNLQIGAISPRPLVLIGSRWKLVFETFWKTFDGQVQENSRALLRFAQNAEEAIGNLG